MCSSSSCSEWSESCRHAHAHWPHVHHMHLCICLRVERIAGTVILLPTRHGTVLQDTTPTQSQASGVHAVKLEAQPVSQGLADSQATGVNTGTTDAAGDEAQHNVADAVTSSPEY